MCVLHYPNQDFRLVLCLDLGKRFRSPKKMLTERGQREAKRNSQVSMQTARCQLTLTPSVSPSLVPVSSDGDGESMTTPIGEVLLGDKEYGVYELPTECTSESMDTSLTSATNT